MADYDLAGTGVQTLSGGTNQLLVEATSDFTSFQSGQANPPNYYGVGLIRLGNGPFYYPARPIDGANIVIDVPSGVTQFAYALFRGATIRVGENIEPPPPGGFVSSSADGQTIANGASVTINWGSLGVEATPTDWVLIQQVGAGIDRAQGVFGSSGWAYTNSCTTTAGGTASTAGSCTKSIVLGAPGPGDYEAFLLTADSNTILFQTGIVIVITL